jgi:hypothetical protein
MAPRRASEDHERGSAAGANEPYAPPLSSEMMLNGHFGLVLAGSDGQRAALPLAVSDGRVTRVDAMRSPAKPRRLSV